MGVRSAHIAIWKHEITPIQALNSVKAKLNLEIKCFSS